MLIKKIKINKIEITNFDYKTNKITLQISFYNENPLTYNLTINSKPEQIAEEIITRIKQDKKPITDTYYSNDILDSISIIHLDNDEEELQEKIFKGILRIQSKAKNLLYGNNISSNYMNTLYILKNLKETIYRK